MSKFDDILEDIGMDRDKVMLSVTMAIDLFKAGKEIIDLLEEDSDLDEFELLEIIDRYDRAKESARDALIESIKKRREEIKK